MVAAVPGERTALAWQRTGWTALGAGALVLHAAPSWPGLVAGVLLLVSGVLCTALVAPARLRGLAAAGSAGHGVAVPGLVTVATVVLLLVGALAVAAVLVG